jgi:carbon storage regulator
MLVLSRKTNDAILIGDEITIKIIEVRGGGVRIGIDAPKDVGILRAELLLKQAVESLRAEPVASVEPERELLLSVAEGI